MAHPLQSTRFFMTETAAHRLPKAEAEVTFLGRSNAGKSSLLCALCDNWKLARVSKTPGRTRGLNVFEVRRGRWLVDVPGYGFADAAERQRDYWPKMIGTYVAQRPSLKMIFVLIEAERGPMPMDVALLEHLNGGRIPFRIVGTKIDKLNRAQQLQGRAKLAASLGLGPEQIYWVSADKGDGIKELRNAVVFHLE